MRRVYVDMDGVLCDYVKAHNRDYSADKNPFPQARVDFFRDLEVIDGAIWGFNKLQEQFDVWILTRPSVLNPMCYTEKRIWVEKHLGIDACHKLILSTDKSLLRGDYLIDDAEEIGNVKNFKGEHILFGQHPFETWEKTVEYILWLEAKKK